MNVLIIDYPWKKTWLPLYKGAFERRGHEVEVWDGKSPGRFQKPDVVLCTWADRDFTDLIPGARHVMMMRRFEFFHAGWMKYKWDKISALICCNPWIAAQVRGALNGAGGKVHYINNPVDTSKWTYSERGHGYNIGMVCRIHSVKNLPLAAQIVMACGPEYRLHIAGESNDIWIEAYLHELDSRNQIIFHGRVNNNALDTWWDDMNYCLSTSTSEGDPINILEAMAKGIKPVIHEWPGSGQMYAQTWTFDIVEQAVNLITRGFYTSEVYRKYVEETRPVSLADKVVEVALNGL